MEALVTNLDLFRGYLQTPRIDFKRWNYITLSRWHLSFLGPFSSHLAWSALDLPHPSTLWGHSAPSRHSLNPIQSLLAVPMSYGYKIPYPKLFFRPQTLSSTLNSLNHSHVHFKLTFSRLHSLCVLLSGWVDWISTIIDPPIGLCVLKKAQMGGK